MTHPNQIPHLIKLLDDDSPEIHERVYKELAAFGPILKDELQKLPFVPNTIQFKHLKQILTVQKKTSFKREWLSWFPLKENHEKLEKALGYLASLLGDFETKERVTALLDDLAWDYQKNTPSLTSGPSRNSFSGKKVLRGIRTITIIPKTAI